MTLLANFPYITRKDVHIIMLMYPDVFVTL